MTMNKAIFLYYKQKGTFWYTLTAQRIILNLTAYFKQEIPTRLI